MRCRLVGRAGSTSVPGQLAWAASMGLARRNGHLSGTMAQFTQPISTGSAFSKRFKCPHAAGTHCQPRRPHSGLLSVSAGLAGNLLLLLKKNASTQKADA
jgi:hypothetical protein